MHVFTRGYVYGSFTLSCPDRTCTVHDKWRGRVLYDAIVVVRDRGLVAWVGGVVASAITGVSGRFKRSIQSLNLAI